MRKGKLVKQAKKAYLKALNSQKAEEKAPKLLENYLNIKKQAREKRRKKLAPKEKINVSL